MDTQVVIVQRLAKAMQSIMDSVDAHPYYVIGEVYAHQLPRVMGKLSARYPDLSRDRYYAYRLRKAGKVSHRLIVYEPSRARHNARACFCLMASEPDGSGEKWRDARERRQRLVIFGYELVRHHRPGQDRPSWTYRIQKHRYKQMLDEVSRAVAAKDDELLESIIRNSLRWPGFAGVRQQHYALGEYLAQRWRRVRGYWESPPKYPRLSYVTRSLKPI